MIHNIGGNKLAEDGIIVYDVTIQNIELPRDLKQAIENKQVAEQLAEAMVHVLQQEELEAERVEIEARGIATAQAIIDETLTPEYLQFRALEVYDNLAGSENTTFVLAIGENGMPMILNTGQ